MLLLTEIALPAMLKGTMKLTMVESDSERNKLRLVVEYYSSIQFVYFHSFVLQSVFSALCIDLSNSKIRE